MWKFCACVQISLCCKPIEVPFESQNHRRFTTQQHTFSGAAGAAFIRCVKPPHIPHFAAEKHWPKMETNKQTHNNKNITSCNRLLHRHFNSLAISVLLFFSQEKNTFFILVFVCSTSLVVLHRVHVISCCLLALPHFHVSCYAQL